MVANGQFGKAFRLIRNRRLKLCGWLAIRGFNLLNSDEALFLVMVVPGWLVFVVHLPASPKLPTEIKILYQNIVLKTIDIIIDTASHNPLYKI